MSFPSHPVCFRYSRLLVNSQAFEEARPLGRPEQSRETQRVPREYTHIYTAMPPQKNPKIH